MSERKIVIAGNWKMHKTADQARKLVSEIKAGSENGHFACEVVVAPTFTSIWAAAEAATGSSIHVAGQNVHPGDEGAFTGEISSRMLKDAGCSHVIIGHSERRQYFGETDVSVNQKILAAMKGDLVPIFCLGETLEEREYGGTFDLVSRQLSNGLLNVQITDPEKFIIAYEPVWAIGTGKTATPDQAEEVHSYLRNELKLFHGAEIANGVRILYGGSLKPGNAEELLSRPNIDGGLIGAAALSAADFLGIIKKVR